MKEQVFISVVVYLHNCERTIESFIRFLDKSISDTFEDYEIVLVNDCSKDKTLERARMGIKGLKGDCTIINLSRKHGVEQAMMAGLNKSMGDFVFEIESTTIDYADDIFSTLYQYATSENNDIVAASSDRTSFHSKVFYKLLNKLSYLDMSLSTESIRLVSRRALNAMLNLKEKVRYRKALYEYTGYSKAVLHYEADKSVPADKKKLNRENISLAIDVLVSFSNAGLKLAHYLSILFFTFSMLMGGYTIYSYLFNESIVQGWTTTMIFVSFGFAGLFFIVGLLGEYISRILIETQNRPFYTTKSVESYKPERIMIQKVEKEREKVLA
ncbi:glycosyltransferase [Paenibacillus assamensis]|uniref:glycosyltransferase n=1 Tax=Paenibacillus assamensis TaxID=311244 RepID=UPI000426F754|nr:glycosyltransferase [Paenibacillus assamensis]